MLSINERRSEAGATLIELLVGIVIFGVIGGITTSATVSGLQASRRVQARVEALGDLTRGLERIGRELRAADPLDLSQVATAADASFEVGARVIRNGEIAQYRYYLDVTADGTPVLLEDVRFYDIADTALTTELRRNEGLFIVNTVNKILNVPLLTYLDANGAEITCDPAWNINQCRSQLATADQVRLRLVRSLPEQDPITVETFINVRQARIS